jgi:2'-5' RNA ligase
VPRAFVALPLPGAHRALLEGYLAACAEAAPSFRWVPAESLHLTLRFLGAVDDQVLDRVSAELARIERPAYEASLGELGLFGGRRRTSVVCLDLAAGREPTAVLAADCERACQAAGLAADGRPYRPHVTLARARARAGDSLPDLPSPPSLPGWRVDEFVLYESRLGGGRPPEYLPLARFSLGR